LQIYDKLTFDVGPLTFCGAVPPLLAAFYVALGGLQIAADLSRRSDASTMRAWEQAQWPLVAFNMGCACNHLAFRSGCCGRTYGRHPADPYLPAWRASAHKIVKM
jgi:hypothetical protein